MLLATIGQSASVFAIISSKRQGPEICLSFLGVEQSVAFQIRIQLGVIFIQSTVWGVESVVCEACLGSIVLFPITKIISGVRSISETLERSEFILKFWISFQISKLVSLSIVRVTTVPVFNVPV